MSLTGETKQKDAFASSITVYVYYGCLGYLDGLGLCGGEEHRLALSSGRKVRQNAICSPRKTQ